MIGWIWRFFVGIFKPVPPHQHTWKIIDKGRWEDEGMGTCGSYYWLQCQGCGDVKRVRK